MEDDLGETLLHFLIRSLLLTLVRRYLAEQGVRALVGSDQFVYWVPGNPHRSVAPDLYLVRGVNPDRPVTSWRVWDEGQPPQLAVEVVSEDFTDDYVHGPRRYAELGVDELILYDPEASGARIRWQAYRRRNGELLLEQRTNDDRVWCASLGCFLREVGSSGGLRLRLGVGERGETLVPTAEEAEHAAREAEHAAKEAEHAAKEAEHAAKEAEHAAKEGEFAAKERERALEQEISRLREELARR